jgi:hypothetical protein
MRRIDYIIGLSALLIGLSPSVNPEIHGIPTRVSAGF